MMAVIFVDREQAPQSWPLPARGTEEPAQS